MASLPGNPVELTLLIPCLNEARTLPGGLVSIPQIALGGLFNSVVRLRRRR
ncbi:MAG: hypothetical protein NT173_11510 [Opitutales bacterium]|nr:hypothetical protein [Opitutales bacterium]